MKILMITIGYPPYAVGGTETYVMGLIEALRRRGHESVVAYLEPFEEPGGPGIRIDTYEYAGTRVHKVCANTALYKLELMAFDPDLMSLLVGEFKKIERLVQPDIIHIHPLQLGLESYLIEAFNQEEKNVLLTYHSTNTSCARGDLIYMGTEVCDGLMIKERCTHCNLHWKGVAKPIAKAMAKVPSSWYRASFDFLKPYPSLKKLRSIASIPVNVDERFKLWKRATGNAKAVVAVCEWVKETIIKNHVPAEKVIFSRHGLRLVPKYEAVEHTGRTLFGYLGRISPEKGIQSLIGALRQIPSSVDFEFEICSWTFDDPNPRPERQVLLDAMYKLAREDKRVKIIGSVSDSNLSSVLARWDAIVVPSFWLESGPEVIYEALAVKTPVIGSRRGGIAELVKEGESGYLYKACDDDELSALIVRFAEDATALREMRDRIPAVRTTEQVADDMEKLYAKIVTESAVSYAV